MRHGRHVRRIGHDATTHSDRRRAETLDAAGVFGHVFEHSSEAMKLIDLDGRIVRWNPACRELYGWIEDEVLGEVLPHIPPDMRLRVTQDIRAIAASGVAVTREATVLTKDGAPVTVSLTVVPYFDAESNPVGVVGMATRVHRASDLTLPADLSVAFAGSARAPLSALVGYARLLLQADIVEDAHRRRRTIRAIEENLAAVTDLLDDVELAAESYAGSSPVSIEEVSPVRVLMDAVRKVEGSTPDRGFVIESDQDTSRVRIGHRALERAFVGLLGLAARRAGEGGQVSATLTTAGDSVNVAIEARPSRDADRIGEPVGSTDTDTVAWYLADLVTSSAGGSLTRFEGREETVTYRIMLPVSTTLD